MGFETTTATRVKVRRVPLSRPRVGLGADYFTDDMTPDERYELAVRVTEEANRKIAQREAEWGRPATDQEKITIITQTQKDHGYATQNDLPLPSDEEINKAYWDAFWSEVKNVGLKRANQAGYAVGKAGEVLGSAATGFLGTPFGMLLLAGAGFMIWNYSRRSTAKS